MLADVFPHSQALPSDCGTTKSWEIIDGICVFEPQFEIEPDDADCCDTCEGGTCEPGDMGLNLGSVNMHNKLGKMSALKSA